MTSPASLNDKDLSGNQIDVFKDSVKYAAVDFAMREIMTDASLVERIITVMDEALSADNDSIDALQASIRAKQQILTPYIERGIIEKGSIALTHLLNVDDKAIGVIRDAEKEILNLETQIKDMKSHHTESAGKQIRALIRAEGTENHPRGFYKLLEDMTDNEIVASAKSLKMIGCYDSDTSYLLSHHRANSPADFSFQESARVLEWQSGASNSLPWSKIISYTNVLHSTDPNMANTLRTVWADAFKGALAAPIEKPSPNDRVDTTSATHIAPSTVRQFS